jgi:DNA-binding winged helix-turn-helix (wHTH) protein
MNAIGPPQAGVLKFGSFELSPARRLLAREGRALKIGSRAFDLLIVLVENAGRVISKDELLSRVWGNVIVEDTNLRVHVSFLRRLLGDDGLESRYIVHVARRGYIFVAPLEHSESDPLALPIVEKRVRWGSGASSASSGVHR